MSAGMRHRSELVYSEDPSDRLSKSSEQGLLSAEELVLAWGVAEMAATVEVGRVGVGREGDD